MHASIQPSRYIGTVEECYCVLFSRIFEVNIFPRSRLKLFLATVDAMPLFANIRTFCDFEQGHKCIHWKGRGKGFW